MELSVVIPTRNKGERLALALHSYLPQWAEGGKWELIVVADGCSDGTLELLHAWRNRLHLRVVMTPGEGQSAARNRGARAASGRLLAFMDDDVLLCPNYLARCVQEIGEREDLVVRATVYTLYYLRVFRDPAVGTLYPEYEGRVKEDSPFRQALLQGHTILNDWPAVARQCHRQNRFERLVQHCLAGGPGAQRLPWMGLSGSGVLLDRRRFLASGGYDEAFGLWWGAEALELGYRLWMSGTEFRHLEGIYSAHMDHPRESSLETYDRSFAYFSDKHRDPDIPLIARLIQRQDDFVAVLDEKRRAGAS